MLHECDNHSFLNKMIRFWKITCNWNFHSEYYKYGIKLLSSLKNKQKDCLLSATCINNILDKMNYSSDFLTLRALERPFPVWAYLYTQIWHISICCRRFFSSAQRDVCLLFSFHRYPFPPSIIDFYWIFLEFLTLFQLSRKQKTIFVH